MATNDVVKRTEELRDSLRKLAESSDSAGTSLGALESILNGIKDTNVSNIREAGVLIANFSKQLRGLTNDSAVIKNLTDDFLKLNAAIQAAQTTRDKMAALGTAGAATKKLNLAVAAGDVGEQNRQQKIIQTQKLLAQQASDELAATEQIWKRNLEFAQKIEQWRTQAIRSLLGARDTQAIGFQGLGLITSGNIKNYPQLPASTYRRGLFDMGAGSEFVPPPIPTFPTALPTGNVPGFPQLPSGYEQPYLLPPKAATSSMYNRNRVYPPPTPSEEFLGHYRTPPTAQVPLQLLSGRADIDDAINERIRMVGDAFASAPVSPNTAQAAEDFDKKAAERPQKTVRETRETLGNQTLKDFYAKQIPINPQVLQNLGLSSVAANNLNKRFVELGMSEARLMGNTTELSTGIQTLSFQAIDEATGAVRNFTTHLDRNGAVLADTQKRFRGFGSAIMRDVVEVLKWTIAITAIYTPIRKMGEMMEEMKKIQLDLVDVQIVLGNSTREMSTVLEASAKIATETSSTLEGVIEGYSLAASASASAGNEIERMVTTETLLKDSMVLSKIANIDQKQALDTLVGSLSQLGMGLTQGTQLLDSWVAVSKKANVSVKDMATSFTIVGSAAEEAGLSYNELNALIGGLAQSTNLSADELGNAIRGIISAMQTDKAQQQFAEYGIATKTVANDFRDLMSILKEMKVLSQTGVLDEKAMGALTQAGGAGARRGAQLSAIVQNLDKVMALVSVSEQASGDAAQAMALEMKTLDAATTRLNNAFSLLSVTLGGEGGVLGFLTLMTNTVTELVKGMGSLVGIMRGAAPIFATFILARAALLKTPQGGMLLDKSIPKWLQTLTTLGDFSAVAEGGKETIAGKKLSRIFSRAQGTGWGTRVLTEEGEALTTPRGWYSPTMQYEARPSTRREFASSVWGRMKQPFFPGLAGAGAGPFSLGNINFASLLGPAIIAATNIGREKGGERALAGGIGALPGILAGSPLWSTIGSIIATGFYDEFLTFEGDLAAGWTRGAAAAKETVTGTETPEQLLDMLSKQAKSSMSWFENLKANVLLKSWNIFGSKTPLGMPAQGYQQISKTLTGEAGTGEKRQLTFEEALIPMILSESGVFFDETTRQKLAEALNRWLYEQADKGLLAGDIPMTPVQTNVKAEMSNVARYAATASEELIKQAIDAMSKGAQGSIATYSDVQDSAKTLAYTAASLIEAQQILGRQINETLGFELPMKNVGEYTPIPGYQAMAPEAAVSMVAGLNTEQKGAITSAYTEVKDILDNIYNLNKSIEGQTGGATPEQIKLMEAYKIQLADVAKRFPEVINAIQQASLANQGAAKLKEIITLPEMTPEQLDKVRAEADRMWREYLKASGLTDDEINAFIAGENEKILKIGESISGIKVKAPSEYWTGATQALGLGETASISEMTDITTAQLQQMMMMYPQLIKSLEQTFKNAGMNWQPNEQDVGIVTADGFETLHVDLSLLGLLQRDLLEETKKQGLQGIYNLPEGATFMVPVTAYEMSKATVTEMAGGGGSAATSILQSILDLLKTTLPQYTEEEKAAKQHEQMLESRINERINRRTAHGVSGTETTTTAPTTAPTPLDIAMAPFLDAYKTNGMYDPSQRVIQENTITPTPTQPTTWFQDFISTLISTLRETFYPEYKLHEQTPQTAIPPASPMAQTEVSTEMPPWLKSFFGGQTPPFGVPMTSAVTTPPSTQQPPVTTALNLSVDSTVQLMVDGRTLATIVKPFLYQDLIRYMTSANSSINRSVVG